MINKHNVSLTLFMQGNTLQIILRAELINKTKDRISLLIMFQHQRGFVFCFSTLLERKVQIKQHLPYCKLKTKTRTKRRRQTLTIGVDPTLKPAQSWLLAELEHTRRLILIASDTVKIVRKSSMTTNRSLQFRSILFFRPARFRLIICKLTGGGVAGVARK